ncbi:MAG: 5-(carboxyamino)imidazole ribonucleotide mutase [Armatimonadetes bacterium]|nr:5-(carboxyamino)imidazole ribonucleotide mutase [Armatimonadota bacterium]
MAEPLVGIIMGSVSDLDTMTAAEDALKEFGVPYELTVVSAHRTPDRMVDYAKTAKSRGLKVIIAGAGGAAHLPGMVASMTTLPVVGVPVSSKALSGLDSLYSIVQMPAGIPVATVAIGNARNAGLLAVQILAVSDPVLSDRLERFRTEQTRQVLESSDRSSREG